MFQVLSLYDFMETDEYMALLVFTIKKSLKRNAKIDLHGGEPMKYIILC
jgi:hypothetical protein